MENKKSKNILFISSLQLFPAESGGQLRSSNICLALSNKGHRVHIYSFTGRKKDYFKKKVKTKNIKNFIKETVNYNFIYAFLQYVSYKFYLPPIWITFLLKLFISKELHVLIESSDYVILDFPFLYPLAYNNNPKFILNTHNAEFLFQKNQGLYRRILRKTVKYIESQAFKKIEKVILCSKEDSQSFKDNNINIKEIFYISNGVNISDFVSNNISKSDYRKTYNIDTEARVILFTGSQFHPNKVAYEFLKDFTAKYRAHLESLNIVFIVAGSVSNHAFNDGQLIVTGRVESILDYFFMSDVAINPIITGSGTNVKMMEYLAAYLPILTTDFGSRGLNLTDKRNCYKFNYENLMDIIHEIFTNVDNKDLQLVAKQAYKDNLKYFDINVAIESLHFL